MEATFRFVVFSLVPVTSLFIIPFLLLFIPFSFPFCPLGLRFFYSRTIFIPLLLHIISLLERSFIFAGLLAVHRATSLLHSHRRCPQFCSIHSRSANFLSYRTLTGVSTVLTKEIMDSLSLHRLASWNRTRPLDPQSFQFPFHEHPLMPINLNNPCNLHSVIRSYEKISHNLWLVRLAQRKIYFDSAQWLRLGAVVYKTGGRLRCYLRINPVPSHAYASGSKNITETKRRNGGGGQNIHEVNEEITIETKHIVLN
jgi:hypothetical protein